MKRVWITVLVLLVGISAMAGQPNMVLVFIDAMGWGGGSCFGNTDAATPNIDAMAKEGIKTRDLSEDAQSINQRGTTIVPLEVKIQKDGDIYIRAKDPAYANPGPDEVQKF